MNYQRPNPFRFVFHGLDLKDAPDALESTKYPCAQNIRGTNQSSITARPGYEAYFSTGGVEITDIGSSAYLGTDDTPRFFARDTSGNIWDDANTNITTLTPGLAGINFLTMRPNKSPQSWIYVTDENNSAKFTKGNNNNYYVYPIGIAEPSNACTAGMSQFLFTHFGVGANNGNGWANNGTAGTITGGYWTSGYAGNSIADPTSSNRTSFTVSGNTTYHIGELLSVDGNNCVVTDVIPGAGNLTVAAVAYPYGNNTAVVVPSQLSIGQNGVLGSFRRGTIIDIGGNNALVLGTTVGTSGMQCFEVNLAGVTSNSSISSPTTIVISGNANSGATLIEYFVKSTFSAGEGTMTFALASSPFGTEYSGSGILPQTEDYVHMSVNVDLPDQVVAMELRFNVDVSDTTCTKNYYYHDITPSTLDVGYLQWTEIKVPISSLTRVGSDTSRSLSNCTAVQLYVNMTGASGHTWTSLTSYSVNYEIVDSNTHVQKVISSGVSGTSEPSWNTTGGTTSDGSVTWMDLGIIASTVDVRIGSLWVGGGGQLDIGESGANYRYRAVPFSSITGTMGNPSPDMHYGMPAVRQSVTVTPPSATYDSQIDNWLIYRYGGSVTSWRFIGTCTTGGTFVDNYYDSAALGGSLLETDNFEPWPSVGLPFTVSSGITISGTALIISGATWPSDIARWLPGTLINIDDSVTCTLNARPRSLGSNYAFDLVECAGTTSATQVSVPEPRIAKQPAPWTWGPDAKGVMFAVGDPLRPGVLNFSKANEPDSAADNSIELTPPSEPLLGGEIISGLAMTASPSRWWALYPSFETDQVYTPVEQRVGRGLVAPRSLCSDGQFIYFWAKDCIARTSGGAYEDLTSTTGLYPLFPHEGALGTNVTRGPVTFYAPDYSKSASFRLSVGGGYLYANYKDYTGTRRTLVMNTTTGAWVSDTYYNSITTHYFPAQQSGPVTSNNNAYPMLVMGDNTGTVWKQKKLVSDNSNPIPCVLGTFEFDAGDPRATKQWGDSFIDLIASSNVSVVPYSLGSNNGVPGNRTISTSATRTSALVSFNGGTNLRFLGMYYSWNESFNNNVATELFLWQPSYLVKPESSTDRYGDWEGSGSAYYRGFTLRADTYGANKNITVRNGDSNNSYNQTINHNGEKEINYYFSTPFVAHTVRFESANSTAPWRFMGINWIKDPWPELTQARSPWMNCGVVGSKYFLSAVIPMDTNGNAVTLTFTTSEGGTVSLGPFTTTAEQKTPMPVAFIGPLIGREVQITPSAPCRVWWDEISWNYDPYPELIAAYTPIMVFSEARAHYVRGIRVVGDSNNNTVTLNVRYDGNQNATALTGVWNGKQTVPFSVTPFVAHEIQLVPNAEIRLWTQLCNIDGDVYPELVAEGTSVMVFSGADARFVQGIKLVVDTGNNNTGFRVYYDGGQTGPLFYAQTSGKTPVPVSFNATGNNSVFIAHSAQIIPQGPARIWESESAWVSEATPESALTWTTQWTSHGLLGFHHIGRLQVSYCSNANATLTITSDGVSPANITLPTSNNSRVTLTVPVGVNKGSQYKYTAASNSSFQLFLNDWVVWIMPWSGGDWVQWKNFGGIFGDGAKI